MLIIGCGHGGRLADHILAGIERCRIHFMFLPEKFTVFRLIHQRIHMMLSNIKHKYYVILYHDTGNFLIRSGVLGALKYVRWSKQELDPTLNKNYRIWVQEKTSEEPLDADIA